MICIQSHIGQVSMILNDGLFFLIVWDNEEIPNCLLKAILLPPSSKNRREDIKYVKLYFCQIAMTRFPRNGLLIKRTRVWWGKVIQGIICSKNWCNLHDQCVIFARKMRATICFYPETTRKLFFIFHYIYGNIWKLLPFILGQIFSGPDCDPSSPLGGFAPLVTRMLSAHLDTSRLTTSHHNTLLYIKVISWTELGPTQLYGDGRMKCRPHVKTCNVCTTY